MSKNDDLVRRLRPCPFCGGEASIMPGSPDGFFVHHHGGWDCAISEMYSYRSSTEADAIEAWNRRHPDTIERGAAQGVRVKPLDWLTHPSYFGWRAESIIGTYRVDAETCCWRLVGVSKSASFTSSDDAKAAAQADYEHRIRSALDLATPPAPAPDAGEDHMVPCAQCGKPVDTREVEEGGDPHGAEMTCDGVWVCSISCYAAFDPSKPSPTPQPPAVERLGQERYVPGVWRCPKCKFRLVQANLNGRDGTVTARDEPGDKCPNCDGPLWRVTWKDEAQENLEIGEQQVARAVAAEASNKALRGHTIRVMASLAAAISLLERSPKTAAPSDKMFDQMLADYRKSLEEARALLSETGGE